MYVGYNEDMEPCLSANRIPVSEELTSPQQKRKLVGDLTRDFRYSFKYSQGNPSLQHILFMFLRDYYKEIDSIDSGQTSQALLAVDGHIKRFVPPPQHVEVNAETAASDFRTMFTEFNAYLTQPGYISVSDSACYVEGVRICPFPQDRKRLFGIMLDKMIEQDGHYLAEGGRYALQGRPRSSESGADPYESFLRTYILGGMATNSVAYDAIFSEACDVLEDMGPEYLAEHKAMWEARHPHENYVMIRQ